MQVPLSDPLPIGEWRPDVAGPMSLFAKVATNCISQGADYWPFSSFMAAGLAALPGTCRGACAVRDSVGTVHIFAGTETAIYKLTGTAWVDVTRASGVYAVPDDGRWVFALYGDRLIAADYSDDTQYFDLGSSTVFDALPNAPKCRAMTVVNNFVMMLNTFDDTDQAKPRRTRWSGLDNTEAWTPSATTQSDFQDLEDSSGEARAVIGYQNYAIIFKADSIVRATYEGPPRVFRFETVETNQGTVGGNTVVGWGQRIFYIAESGLFMFDGQASRSIGYGKVDKTFLDDVKPGSYPKIVSSINPLRKIAVWAYVSKLSPDGLPDKLLIFNWMDERFTLVEESAAQVFISLQVGKTIEDLGDEYGNLEDIPLSLDSSAYVGNSILPAGFSSDNVLGYYNGDPMTATFETAEARLNPNGRAHVSAVFPITDAPDVTVQMITRNLPNAADVTGPMLVQTSATGEFGARSDSMFHRVSITVGGAWSYVRGLQFRASAKGMR